MFSSTAFSQILFTFSELVWYIPSASVGTPALNSVYNTIQREFHFQRCICLRGKPFDQPENFTWSFVLEISFEFFGMLSQLL
jgi:hypothetical protein